MKLEILPAAIGLTLVTFVPPPVAFAQQVAGAPQADSRKDAAPIYRVTVVERTVKAVNYQYRSEPTKINFRGTVLLPHAKGEAVVESKQGHTEVEAKIDGLSAPQRFGGEYLTYVLWAITPEGGPHNMGELIPNSSDKATLHVSTDLQAFALIVTAEPHSAVRQPSDIVVLENEIRPDTAGIIKPVEAKYELLPRGEYTWNVRGNLDAASARPKVSMHEYEAVLELYQAQNAVNMAAQANAGLYAPDTLSRARSLLAEGQQLHDRKADFRQVVQRAREAAQTAEDARTIAQGREQAEQLKAASLELSKTRAELATAERGKQQAAEREQQAKAVADAARQQAQVALAARNQAETEATIAREHASASQTAADAGKARTPREEQNSDLARKRQLRMRLLEELKRSLPTLDTGRGLVVTVPDDAFRGAAVVGASSQSVARVAASLSVQAGLHFSVEGYSDDAAKENLSRERADAVRRLLVANGVAGNAVSAVGMGDSRPVGSNATPQGRKANSRVEIVVHGESIGDVPLWERPYSLTSSAEEFVLK